jgi:hypothetical protein
VSFTPEQIDKKVVKLKAEVAKLNAMKKAKASGDSATE